MRVDGIVGRGYRSIWVRRGKWLRVAHVASVVQLMRWRRKLMAIYGWCRIWMVGIIPMVSRMMGELWLLMMGEMIRLRKWMWWMAIST